MARRISIFILLVFLPLPLFCDPTVLQLYKQRFSRADLAAKAQILNNAASDRTLGTSLGLFYEYALQFAFDNSALLKNDHEMIRIIDTAVKGLYAGNTAPSPASLDVLWGLFNIYQDSTIGGEILVVLGKLGRGNTLVVDNVNNFLTEKNMMFRSGSSVNYALISASIAAIMELGDSSSYPVLFTVLCSGYPEVIAYEAQGAFDFIPGNLNRFLYDAIEKNDPVEKLAALRAGSASQKLKLSDRGQLAELALEQGLAVSDTDEYANLSALRYAAVRELTALRWTRANSLAIRNYYRVLADYQQNHVPKERFIEAIALLGAVGNSEAALVLGLQLGLINARTERTGEYDEEITQAIVQALGLIGDKAAFDHLLIIDNLPYHENIQAAAREAVSRLKW
jgi:hypothetical protein